MLAGFLVSDCFGISWNLSKNISSCPCFGLCEKVGGTFDVIMKWQEKRVYFNYLT